MESTTTRFAKAALLTITLAGACSLIWSTLSPDELSTHDHSPYSIVRGIEGGSR